MWFSAFASAAVPRKNSQHLTSFDYLCFRSTQDPALSTGIRHLIYNAIGLDHTYRSSLVLTIPLIRWLLSETDWMDEEASKLCAYLVRLEQVTWPLQHRYIRVLRLLCLTSARSLFGASSCRYSSDLTGCDV